MNNKNLTTGQKLAGLSNGKVSSWSEKAKWRRENRSWLRRSAEIAMHILDALDNKGMSQKQLAEILEVSPQFVSKIAKGEENLSLQTIGRIERALGVELIAINNFSYRGAVTIQKKQSPIVAKQAIDAIKGSTLAEPLYATTRAGSENAKYKMAA